MSDVPVTIRFASLIRPDMQGLWASLTAYASWQPGNRADLPMVVEWPIEVRDRLNYLRNLLDGSIAWPPGVSYEAREQVKSLAEDLVRSIEAEVVAGARLILTVGDLGGSHTGALTPDETESLLDLYISAKAMALIRLLLAFRLECPPDPKWQEKFYHLHADPAWMQQFYHLHVNWGFRVINGLPYVIQDRGDDVLYWTDATASQVGVVEGGIPYNIYVPGTLDIVDRTNPVTRIQFITYLAPQLVEELVRRGDGGSALVSWVLAPKGWRISLRHASFIELISFHTQPWHNIRIGYGGVKAEAIHKHVLDHLRTLIEEGRLGPDGSDDLELLEDRFSDRFPLKGSSST